MIRTKFVLLSTFLICILFLFLNSNLKAQNINPDYNKIFIQNELTTIELFLSEADKQALVYPEDPSLNQFFPVDFHIANSKIDTVFGPIGVRIRGNTSRGKVKKSFKIDFKEFGGDQFKKLKKLNLKPNSNDPSMVREPLSWLVYRAMNVPAARTSYVNLYMNNEFMGVYQNVENIDDEFVDRRYGNELGNLYKCTWGANLVASNNVYDNRLFELKTNETINDRSKLRQLVDVLNSPQTNEWTDEMETIFDVDNYIRQLAVEAMIGHWDGYSYNTNNFYLYENPESRKIHFIPYDLDNTWGIDWIGPNWGREDVMTWYSNNLKVPLTTKILKIPDYQKKYINYLNEVLGIWYESEVQAQNYFDLIASSVANDVFYTYDFGYAYNDFLSSLDQAWNGHVDYGIFEYIDTRYTNALKQIPALTGDSVFENSGITVYPNPCNEFLTINSSENMLLQVKVIGLDGRIYRNHRINSAESVDVSSLRNAAYLIQVISEQGTYNQIIRKE